MALDFPASPSPGQTFVAGGVTWTWDGTKWVFQGAAGSGVYLPLTGGTISGNLTVQGSTSVQALTCTSINGAPAVFPAMRNRVINGSMRVDQRNGGAVWPAAPAGVYAADRWLFTTNVPGKFNLGQNLLAVSPPAGFANYIGFQVAAAYAVSAADYFVTIQSIEGLNIGDLGWGAAGAQAVTLSFWARSSVTGTHSGVLRNGAANRSYPFSFSLPSANTWTQISLTVPGDTTGTWTKDNSAGLQLVFCLGAGGSAKGTANAWAATGYLGVTGAVNVVATLGATFQITGVQLEPGSVATPYEWRHYGFDLSLCQRYYQRFTSTQAGGVQIYGNAYAAGLSISVQMTYPPMRASPTLTFIGTWVLTNSGAPASQIYAGAVNLALLYATSVAAGSIQSYSPANGGLDLSAEL